MVDLAAAVVVSAVDEGVVVVEVEATVVEVDAEDSLLGVVVEDVVAEEVSSVYHLIKVHFVLNLFIFN